MSADNWTTCPRCKRRHAEKATKLRAEADAAYGSTPRDEWMALDTQAREAGFDFRLTDFREDYEVGIDEDGVVTLDYSGCCRNCGLTAKVERGFAIEVAD